MSHSFLNGSVEEDDVDFFMSLRQRVFKPVEQCLLYIIHYTMGVVETINDRS